MTKPKPAGNDDRTIDLALGLLSAKDEEIVLESIRNDPEAERDLVNLVALRESLKGELPPRGRTVSTIPPRKRSNGLIGPMGALLAACLVVVVIRAVWFGGSTVGIEPIPVPSELSRLRGPTGSAEELARGLAAYESGNFPESARILLGTSGIGATEMVRLIYLGSAYNQAGVPDEAIEILQDLPFETIPDPWGSEGARNLIHALRATGAGEAADELEMRLSPMLEENR